LPPPRPSKGELSSPDALAVVSGGGASIEKVYDLLQRVSSIEKSVAYLEGHADDARKKLDTIATDITDAKATFRTLKWLFTAICIAVWGVLSAAALMWAKHRFGW
jgi:geranylgeranyl pyrophosphate synthase